MQVFISKRGNQEANQVKLVGFPIYKKSTINCMKKPCILMTLIYLIIGVVMMGLGILFNIW
jgi:hypothetical protein